jgi:glycyl-tRNA synthetase beta chain
MGRTVGRPLLLEIGVEEVPARFIPGALEQLKEKAGAALSGAHLACGLIKAYATPRRLTVLVEGVAERQTDTVEEAFGPPRKVAYADDGTLTKAGEGFARSQGVAPGALVVRSKGKGEYVVAVVERRGREAREVLPDILRDLVLSLHFPKAMRWGEGSIRFVRPIQWLLALHGPDTVEFEIEGLRSGRTTRGHRFLSPGDHRLEEIAYYSQLLEDNHVIVDMARRVDIILKQAGVLAGTVGGALVEDPDLLEHVACIVEYPVAVRGEFDPRYLRLPEELLTAVMRGHQKYFSVRGQDGALLNHFIVVSNTLTDNAHTVRVGAERVVRARFDDAEFYYTEDTNRTLASRIADLGNVTYHERLGSVREKVIRMKAIAAALADRICPGKKEACVRAAELAKCDLITGVVFEFPELQGVMGGYYALNDGETDEVARAIREQYLPAFSGDRVPASDVGAVVSLADRVEGIAAFFSIGLRPTGSEDPFALRRHALAAVAILLERGYSLSIRELIAPALAAMGGAKADLEAEVMGFFAQRVEHQLQLRGVTPGVVRSVLPIAADTPLARLVARAEAIQAWQGWEGAAEFLAAIKRVRNITKATADESFSEELFREEAERSLYAAVVSVRTGCAAALDGHDYAGALAELGRLAGPIDAFFDAVLVMDKDEAVRRNRLGQLREIWALASSVCDFSELD